ncbi:MAG: hypothetical protein Phog2KO_29110 [Phototrophicaceae bacterium]
MIANLNIILELIQAYKVIAEVIHAVIESRLNRLILQNMMTIPELGNAIPIAEEATPFGSSNILNRMIDIEALTRLIGCAPSQPYTFDKESIKKEANLR